MVKTEIQVSHLAFADESHWNSGRFRSLALVTLRHADLPAFSYELQRLLEESKVKEFKWERLRDARYRFAALKLGTFAIEQAARQKLRLDILMWDTEDSRHSIRGRDDVQNLGRMYYQLFKYVLRERWPDKSTWRLHPDEHTALDWPNVEEYLDRASMRARPFADMFSEGKIKISFKVEFKIAGICPLSSTEEPFIQVADLFAGLVAFSRESYAEFEKWQRATNPQPKFEFEVGEEEAINSHSNKERFVVIQELNTLCKTCRLGVSLRTHKGFRTRDPRNPVNFWWYEPQHIHDKAPTKAGR
jgi:hypothetical protein